MSMALTPDMMVWYKWLDDDPKELRLRKDAPEEAKKAFEEFQKEMKEAEEQGIRL